MPRPPLATRLAGHLSTVVPSVFDPVLGVDPPAGNPWSVHPPGGAPLTGVVADPGDTDRLVVLVHGIGSSADAWYVRRAAQQAHEAGLATLRLNLRGADRSGAAVYHAGLTEDLHAALAGLGDRWRHVRLLGFSLGGHVTLRAATESLDRRVQRVAAISPPLDLEAAAAWVDRRSLSARLYRDHLLSGLREIHAAALAAGQPLPGHEHVRGIRTMRAWDDVVVAPAFGWTDARAYYDAVSVGPRLHRLSVEALAVHSRRDPIVGDGAIAPGRHGTYPRWTWREIDDGGHVVLPDDADLALGTSRRGLAAVLHWLFADV